MSIKLCNNWEFVKYKRTHPKPTIIADYPNVSIGIIQELKSLERLEFDDGGNKTRILNGHQPENGLLIQH